jgi:hypothetical protein
MRGSVAANVRCLNQIPGQDMVQLCSLGQLMVHFPNSCQSALVKTKNLHWSRYGSIGQLMVQMTPAMDRGFCRQDTHQPKLLSHRPTGRDRGEVDRGECQARPEDGR